MGVMAQSIVVLGARNLGGAIVEHFVGLGWNAAAVARSEDTLAAVRERGALAIQADASDPEALAGALATARQELGSLDAIVNAVTAARPPSAGPFGGGELADADLAAFRGWTVAVAEQAFVFLSTGAAALRDQDPRRPGGTLVQVTGGSSRRAMPGKGLWAAGAFAARALVQAAALELREHGIHAALLAVDATIESPKTAAFTRDAPKDALADMPGVAAAVAFLVQQGPRAMTHELVVTPAGDRWVP
jgi:NAD(P)-dependent dehydrogenase (short-subunit alcohol dehydrogenase family)